MLLGPSLKGSLMAFPLSQFFLPKNGGVTWSSHPVQKGNAPSLPGIETRPEKFLLPSRGSAITARMTGRASR